jgi:hypothetical protein
VIVHNFESSDRVVGADDVPDLVDTVPGADTNRVLKDRRPSARARTVTNGAQHHLATSRVETTGKSVEYVLRPTVGWRWYR